MIQNILCINISNFEFGEKNVIDIYILSTILNCGLD